MGASGEEERMIGVGPTLSTLADARRPKPLGTTRPGEANESRKASLTLAVSSLLLTLRQWP